MLEFLPKAKQKKKKVCGGGGNPSIDASSLCLPHWTGVVCRKIYKTSNFGVRGAGVRAGTGVGDGFGPRGAADPKSWEAQGPRAAAGDSSSPGRAGTQRVAHQRL